MHSKNMIFVNNESVFHYFFLILSIPFNFAASNARPVDGIGKGFIEAAKTPGLKICIMFKMLINEFR